MTETEPGPAQVYDALIGVTQVLSRRSLLEVAYSYSQVDGYQNDPYKTLSVVDPVTGVPSVFCVGGTQDTVMEPVGAAATVMANAGSDAEALPSLAVITMLAKVATFALEGVP